MSDGFDGQSAYERIKSRLYDADFDAVAHDALDGKLAVNVEDAGTWALAGRAIEHHLAMYVRESVKLIDLDLLQVADAIETTIDWPPEGLINQVLLNITVDGLQLHPYWLSRPTLGESMPDDTKASTVVRRWFQGSQFVSRSDTALRPIDKHGHVAVTAVPGHRVMHGSRDKSNWGPWCPAPDAMLAQAHLAIQQTFVAAERSFDGYLAARHVEPIYEFVDPVEIYRQQLEQRREQRLQDWVTAALSVAIVAIGTLVVAVAARLGGLPPLVL